MWDKVGAKKPRGPLLLHPGNFTPPARTPWGGRRIARDLKVELGFDPGTQVGESWELSVEPDFPSRVVGGPTLDEVIRNDRNAWLGSGVTEASTALLVKLLDANDELSLQIHPADDDPALAADESGKPEAWYVVDTEPGAGLHLGFVEGVERDDVEEAVADETDLRELLQFVPVEPGDAFVIEPGTPHAVGRGVLLLEPQRVAPSKRGVTYRYWDWNRRYDESGQPDPAGQPRELHLRRALEVTRWDAPREAALLERIRHRAGACATTGSASFEPMISPTGPLASDTFDVRRLAGSGSLRLPSTEALRAVTVLSGSVVLASDPDPLTIPRGQTAALPACLPEIRVTLDDAHAIVCHLG